MAKGTPDPKRYLHIYTRSPDQKNNFDKLAQENGASTSKFYLNILEEWEQNRGQKATHAISAGDLNTLREENLRLHKQISELSKQADQANEKLTKLRNEAFLKPSGDVALDPELLQTLQAGPIHSHRLLEALGINPLDAEAVRAITRQLEDLERTGFIARGARGWRWLK